MQLKSWDKNWNNPLTTEKDFRKTRHLYPQQALSWWLTQLWAAHLKITIERSPLLASVAFRKREFTDRNDLWYKLWETPRHWYRCFSKEVLFGSKYILVSPTFGTDASGVQIKISQHCSQAASLMLWFIHLFYWMEDRFFDFWVWNYVKIAMEWM